MGNQFPLAVQQLGQNPGRLFFFAIIITALSIVTWFMRSRPRDWHFRQLRLEQVFILAALITATSGAVYGLAYDWTNVSGSVGSYLEGLSILLFWLSWCLSVLLGMRLAVRALTRLMVRRTGNQT
jgi:hypothetical protein